MAITESALLDRVRAVVSGLDFTESVTLDFERQPSGNADAVFTVKLGEVAAIGGMSFSEEWRGNVLISIQRQVNDDYDAARRLLWEDARSIIAAVTRDGAVTSGEYAVEDAGRSVEIDQPKGANYLLARIRVPVNGEGSL